MFYTIGEMAQSLGIAPSTLRFYDKEGLLPFVERSATGIRLFREKDLEWLRIIGCLKKTGMAVKDIRDFIQMTLAGDSTIDSRLKLFLRQREIIAAQLRELEETKEILDFKCWYYETAKKNGTTAVLRNLADEEIPEKFRAVRKKLLAVPKSQIDGQGKI